MNSKNYIREKLLRHRGHNIACVCYGDWEDPADVCIECEDCYEVLISASVFDAEEPEPERIYIVNWIRSDGFFDGSESLPITGLNPDSVIKDAYKQYSEEWKAAKAANGLEDWQAMLSSDEFERAMKAGFEDESDYVVIQTDYNHIQFEGYSRELKREEV